LLQPFLSVGSANTTNRSMILDSELNVSWEAGQQGEDKLAWAIRRVKICPFSALSISLRRKPANLLSPTVKPCF
jgi:hypothetical protein